MARNPENIPLTDLRTDAEGVMRRLRDSRQPIVLTDGGQAAAVMLSVDAYERGEHERQLLRDLLRGEQEIAAGEGYDLATVMAEADALLADEPG
jgi:prevent-host-death family protein